MQAKQFHPVSKEEFFEAINNLNVHPSIQPPCKYPYTSLWIMQDGTRTVIGKSIGSKDWINGLPPEDSYFLYR